MTIRRTTSTEVVGQRKDGNLSLLRDAVLTCVFFAFPRFPHKGRFVLQEGFHQLLHRQAEGTSPLLKRDLEIQNLCLQLLNGVALSAVLSDFRTPIVLGTGICI